jgi:hypothetical protein
MFMISWLYCATSFRNFANVSAGHEQLKLHFIGPRKVERFPLFKVATDEEEDVRILEFEKMPHVYLSQRSMMHNNLQAPLARSSRCSSASP